MNTKLLENLEKNYFLKNSFLNIKFPNFDFNKKINKSSNDKISEDLIKKIAPLYSKTYEYCSNKYPYTLNIWPGFKYI